MHSPMHIGQGLTLTYRSFVLVGTPTLSFASPFWVKFWLILRVVVGVHLSVREPELKWMNDSVRLRSGV